MAQTALVEIALIWNEVRLAGINWDKNTDEYIIRSTYAPFIARLKNVTFPLVIFTKFGEITLPDSPHSPYDFIIMASVMWGCRARAVEQRLELQPQWNQLDGRDLIQHPAQSMRHNAGESGPLPSPAVEFCCAASFMCTSTRMGIFLADLTQGYFQTGEFGTLKEWKDFQEKAALVPFRSMGLALNYSSWRVITQPAIHSWFHQDHARYPMLFHMVRCRPYSDRATWPIANTMPWCTRDDMRRLQNIYRRPEE